MLVALVVVFFMMWGPTMLFNIVRNFRGRYRLATVSFMINKIDIALVAVSFLNSSVNPILLPLTSRPVLHYKTIVKVTMSLKCDLSY